MERADGIGRVRGVDLAGNPSLGLCDPFRVENGAFSTLKECHSPSEGLSRSAYPSRHAAVREGLPARATPRETSDAIGTT
jgi:hypothetical protein